MLKIYYKLKNETNGNGWMEKIYTLIFNAYFILDFLKNLLLLKNFYKFNFLQLTKVMVNF